MFDAEHVGLKDLALRDILRRSGGSLDGAGIRRAHHVDGTADGEQQDNDADGAQHIHQLAQTQTRNGTAEDTHADGADPLGQVVVLVDGSAGAGDHHQHKGDQADVDIDIENLADGLAAVILIGAFILLHGDRHTRVVHDIVGHHGEHQAQKPDDVGPVAAPGIEELHHLIAGGKTGADIKCRICASQHDGLHDPVRLLLHSSSPFRLFSLF